MLRKDPRLAPGGRFLPALEWAQGLSLLARSPATHMNELRVLWLLSLTEEDQQFYEDQNREARKV